MAEVLERNIKMVVDLPWKTFYFGSSFPEENIFLYGEFQFTLQEAGKVVDLPWKTFYFGSSFPEENIFLYGEFQFTLQEAGKVLLTEYSGILPNGTCVDETTYEYEGTHPQQAIGNRAAFLGESYRVFFSSDLDSYLLSVECTLNRPVRRCPLENSLTFLFVKSSRPDSLPLHTALNDFWQTSCVTLDATPGDFRNIFVYGENEC